MQINVTHPTGHVASATGLISVAPMMDRTDSHCRYFMRLMGSDIRLYTEMVTAQAVLRGDRHRLLGFDGSEKPLALQLGGSDPDLLARAAALAEQYHYDEINLNIGCPSDRVQSGRFGACLMPVPNLVADCVRAMGEATTIPVTVKTRIGVDEHDDYDFLASFVEVVAAAGCEIFIVHARKAVLAGLSPKENREVPPLRYPTVYRLKRDFPELGIILNGGIDSPGSVGEHLRHVDGVMIGRKAYADPFFLAGLQRRFLDAGQQHLCQVPARAEIVRAMASYAERQLSQGVRLHHITRHMLGLYSGQPGARQWRRYISENARRRDAGPEVLLDSLSLFTLAA